MSRQIAREQGDWTYTWIIQTQRDFKRIYDVNTPTRIQFS